MKTQPTKSEFSDLPKNVHDYTDDQRVRVVAYLSIKPLAELRSRQSLIVSQIESARQMSAGTTFRQASKEQTIVNLWEMFDLESEAIGQQLR